MNKGIKNETISRAEAREALMKSGYLLESRVEAILREKKWYVETNCAFSDPQENKSRELDVFAGNDFGIGGKVGLSHVLAVMLIECQNNEQPVVCITREPQMNRLHIRDVKMAGIPLRIYRNGEPRRNTLIHNYLKLESFHHYCKGTIASQWCSFKYVDKGNKRWIAEHDDNKYDSIAKLAKATQYFQTKCISEQVERQTKKEGARPLLEIYYPILILQGELLEGKARPRSVSLRESKHVKYRYSCIRDGDEEAYQIDIIKEGYLKRYLELITRECKMCAERLREIDAEDMKYSMEEEIVGIMEGKRK